MNDARTGLLKPLVVQHLEVRETAYFGAPHVAYRITHPDGAPDVLDHSQVIVLRDWLTEWLCVHPDADG